MAFDLETWREKLKERLRDWKSRMQQAGVNSAYAFISAGALWPLVEAYQRGDLTALLTLGSQLAGGVASNLWADEILKWKNEADGVSKLAESTGDPKFRAELDAILEKLDAINLARERLSENDHVWFVETLREELRQLGNLERYQAVLGASGAIAQGAGATAMNASPGAQQITAPVHGPVIGPGGRQIVYVQGQPASDPAVLRAAYLNRLFDSASRLSLAGVDPKVASSESEAQLSLAAIYTAVTTLTPATDERMLRGTPPEREPRRPSALEALNRNRRLVLLGDPGSGKSTFVSFVVLCLSGEALVRSDANLTLLTSPLLVEDDERFLRRKKDDKPQPQRWDHGALLPVRIILRDFVARGLPDPRQKGVAKHLCDFIADDLNSAVLGQYASHLQNELHKDGGLILLDGLDEVPEADQRRVQIKQVVEDFAATFHKCRILVTSRTYAYQRQDWRLRDFTEAVLAPFSGGQIRHFVDRWYTHIAELRGLHRDDAQGRAELLKHAIFSGDRLQALAEHPLLLTLMASLHAWRGGSLPEKREELYADSVDLLLDRWESPKTVRDAQGDVRVLQPSLAEWLRVDRKEVRRLLNELAYKAHHAQPDLKGTADIPEGELVSGLMQLTQNPEVNPSRLVEYLSQRAGLLLPRGIGVYTFPHLTFQEYLAACHLTDDDYPEKLATLARTYPEKWREAALLAAAKATRGVASAVWLLVEALCYREPEDARSNVADLWGAHLAGQALTETVDLSRVSERDKAKVTRVQYWLQHILNTNSLPAVERARAGDTLAHLGDPRFDPEAWYLPEEGLLGFVEIPEGPFLMGTREGDLSSLIEQIGGEREWYKAETPQTEVNLQRYFIAKYPVTVAQFGEFVKNKGYKPSDEDCLSGLPNHPVVNVTCYDALAYCDWLTETLKKLADTPEPLATLLREKGWKITLPSEAQWEKAVRGGKQLSHGTANPNPGRVYPWGDEFDPNKANTDEAKIGSTSAVGSFPEGHSLYGILDMSGNVWEWTRSLWGKEWGKPDFGYPYDPKDKRREALDASDEVLRVLRGGSFIVDLGFARCAYRYRSGPNDWYGSVGFRLVASPF